MIYLNLKITYFLYYQICQADTRTHYFTSTYNLKNGRIVQKTSLLRSILIRKIQSTKKYGSCEEVIFQSCEDEQILICSGNYENLNKITNY